WSSGSVRPPADRTPGRCRSLELARSLRDASSEPTSGLARDFAATFGAGEPSRPRRTARKPRRTGSGARGGRSGGNTGSFGAANFLSRVARVGYQIARLHGALLGP